MRIKYSIEQTFTYFFCMERNLPRPLQVLLLLLIDANILQEVQEIWTFSGISVNFVYILQWWSVRNYENSQ